MAKVTDFDTALIRTRSELDAVRSRFEVAPVLSFDFETTSLDDLTVWGLCLAVPPSGGHKGLAVYIACEKHPTIPELNCELTWEDDVKPFAEALFARNAHYVGHNLKFDTVVLRTHRFKHMPINIFDTMIGSWMLSNQEKKHNLGIVAWRFLRQRVAKDLMEIRETRESDPKLYWLDMERYGSLDGIMPLLLREKMIPLMDKHKIKRAAKEIEMPMIHVTAELEMRGVFIDQDHLHGVKSTAQARIDELEEEIFALAGREFSVGSGVQLAEVMFDDPDGLCLEPHDWMERGKPRGKKNPKPGAWPTNEQVLKSYSHPLCTKVLEWRSRSKLIGTYCNNAIALAEMADDGRLRVSWNQTGTQTGRYSSSRSRKPKFNLQNLPRESGTIRKAVVAEPGFTLIACDYSQIELRLMAHQSGDPTMVEAYLNGEDLHAKTAASASGIDPSEVTKDQRSAAKAINFGFLYGMGAKRFVDYAWLNYGVRTTLEEAQHYRAAYFDTYPGIVEYHDELREYVYAYGFTRNIVGEKRFLPGYRSSDSYEAWQAWSEGVNFTIQGSAGAIIKKAMLNISAALHRPFGMAKSKRYGRVVTLWESEDNLAHEVRMQMQVHDELVFEVRNEIVDVFGPWLQRMMENAIGGFRVPIVCEWSKGPTYEDAK